MNKILAHVICKSFSFNFIQIKKICPNISGIRVVVNSEYVSPNLKCYQNYLSWQLPVHFFKRIIINCTKRDVSANYVVMI